MIYQQADRQTGRQAQSYYKPEEGLSPRAQGGVLLVDSLPPLPLPLFQRRPVVRGTPFLTDG